MRYFYKYCLLIVLLIAFTESGAAFTGNISDNHAIVDRLSVGAGNGNSPFQKDNQTRFEQGDHSLPILQIDQSIQAVFPSLYTFPLSKHVYLPADTLVNIYTLGLYFRYRPRDPTL
jgi:hypothetical protein